MVLKKLGDEQREAFLRVLRFLGQEEGMHVIVEPHEYLKLSDQDDLDFVDTYSHAEGDMCAQSGLNSKCKCETNQKCS